MLWLSSKTFEYPISRAVAYSVVGHLCVAFLLFVLGVLPLPTRKMPRPRIQPMMVQIETVTEPVKKPDEKKGVKREIDVVNARKPVAKPPEPKPTPVPPEPTPKKEAIYEVLPTPKSLIKTAEHTKKVLPTPEPTAKPTKAPTAAPKKPEKESKKVIATPRPTAVATPKAIAEAKLPKPPEAKGDPEGKVEQAPAMMQTEEGVNLPSSYLLDAQQRFKDKFQVPLHVTRQLERQGVQLVCVLSFKIGRDGRIFDVEVSQSTGRDLLDTYAKRTLKDVASLLPLVDYTKKPHITASVAFQFGG